MATVLVIQHEDNVVLGRIEPVWRDAGLDLEIIEAWHQPLPDSVAGFDGLCVLGGSMDCTDDDNFPWLAKTRALIAEAVERDIPFLGTCLGLQLAVVALGGVVERKGHLSLGLLEHRLTDAASDDELFGCLRPGKLAVHYNQDHVSALPDGAVVLSRAADGHIQSARLGRRAWGVQFHPELEPHYFREWTTDKDPAKRPNPVEGTLEQIVDEVDEAEDDLRAEWLPWAQKFAELVKG